MDDHLSPVEVLLERAEAYTRTSIKLFQLKATEKIAKLLSNIATGITIIAIITLIFINLNIGIALLIGDYLGEVWLGFFVIAGFYSLIGLLVYLFRNRWIKSPLSESVISQLLNDEEFDDDLPLK